MIRKAVMLVALVVTLVPGTVLADTGLDVNLSCPATVSYGSGATTLIVRAQVTNNNWYSPPITVKRVMAGLVTNNADSVGGAGLYGPFLRWVTETTLNGPRIDSSTGNHIPGDTATFYISVATVPNVTGKMAAVYAEFLRTDGQSIGGGDCMVNIMP